MTPEQRRLCKGLTIAPTGQREISKNDFVLRFPSAVTDRALASKLFDDALKDKNAEDLECALLVGFTFGFPLDVKELLAQLIDDEWHHSHEDIVDALKIWPVPDTVDALYRATQWIPKYLEFDDSRALAIKAIWAIGRIPGTAAEQKLEELARSSEGLLQACAVKQLKRRQGLSSAAT